MVSPMHTIEKTYNETRYPSTYFFKADSPIRHYEHSSIFFGFGTIFEVDVLNLRLF